MTDSFPAIVVASPEAKGTLAQLSDDDLPEGDVTVDVAYSSLNYKDGLAVTGRGNIIRKYPMVCGVDLAGTVRDSAAPQWRPGDEVVCTGWGLSETHPGGYTRRQRLQSHWLVPRPSDLSLEQTMAVGTAGLTAMLCVLALEHRGLTTETDGEVLVTGAGGGVGSIAVCILARLGYRVIASTGRPEKEPYLKSVGATVIVDRAELTPSAGGALDEERWVAAVDTIGGETLASALRQTRYRGAVAACGWVGGIDLPVTVLPFIQRNIALLGIDSVLCPTVVRSKAWQRLGRDLDTGLLDGLTTVEPMRNVPELSEAILAGRTHGRVVIDTSG
jgi:putative YhdH/YhfP family quinone oxidoreductase